MVSVDDALLHVVGCLPRWKSNSYPPGDADHLCDCICAFLTERGGLVWIEANPHLLKDLEPIYHAAGFRTEEMRRRQAILPVEYGDVSLFFRPEDAERLVQPWCK